MSTYEHQEKMAGYNAYIQGLGIHTDASIFWVQGYKEAVKDLEKGLKIAKEGYCD